MPITMWYRGIRFVKDFLVQYYNYIFMANQKGALLFTDGTKEIKFSRTPVAIKRASWDARNLPAVLVGKASGGMQYVTFSKDLLKTDVAYSTDGSQATTYNSYGGNFDLNINLSIRATTIEERDNLVDIVGIYASHPDTKDYFMNQYLILPEAPKLAGESDIQEPGIDHPIYATELSVRVQTRWQEFKTQENYTLNNVIADLTLETDP
jgi:hypothetical protein